MAVVSNDSVFFMHGARAAIASGMLHIEEQVKALEDAINQNTGLAFDLAKTIVESACKTIISERGNSFDNDDDLPILFRKVKNCLPFLPMSMSFDVTARRSLEQTLNGLHTALQGVCELRNAFGFASHGSAGPRPVMESIQAHLAAQSADAIIGFLYRSHLQDITKPSKVQMEFGDNSDFNYWIDEQCDPVRILALPPYRPSEVLFSVDEQAYRDLLTSYEADEGTQVQEEEVNNEMDAS